jgi:ATP-dependent Clp protease adaptor protein ClpS
MTAPITQTREKTLTKIKEPSKYNVVIFNDDITPMHFVIELLMRVFKHSQQDAERLTITIHTENSAVAGTYVYEIAEQKAIDATVIARNANYPLVIKLLPSNIS